MFQFQGGISDEDKERMFSELQKRGHIVVAENGRVQYPGKGEAAGDTASL